ncbi:ATP-dependent DNA helicase PIF4, partial [Orchesella cincta]
MDLVQPDGVLPSPARRQLTPEQRHRQSELQRLRRAQLTEEQREEIRAKQRRRRAEATVEQRDRRNEYKRNRRAQSSAEKAKEIQNQHEMRRLGVRQTYKCAREPATTVQELYIGQMNFECECCGAFHFEDETRTDLKFSSCCEKGKVDLLPLAQYPDPLQSWLTVNDDNRAKSFEDLRTVNGVVCETFVEAAKLLNLLEDDDNWNKTMEEACQYQMPSQLRMLLATIFLIGEPTNPRALYYKFRDALMEDFIRNHDVEYAEQKSLRDIENHLLQFGKDCVHFGLPTPMAMEDNDNAEPIIQRNAIESERLIALMNTEQRDAFNMIMDSVEGRIDQKCFFLSGVGGSGKTFVYKALISANLARGDIVKVVAPTGLAATLLKNGQTVHSGFRLPINLNETSTSNIVQ